MNTPGWYPDTTMPGTQRYWDGDRWTEHRAPIEPNRGRSATTQVMIVVLGILIALVVVLAVYWFMHANDDLRCAGENAQRAQAGEPTVICPE